MQKLSTMKLNEEGKIVFLSLTNLSIKRRLMEMGFVKNTRIVLKKKAPFKDPIDVELINYEICLQKKIADNIWVEKMQ